ncbi:hypothetical protein Droror1_Dr00003531 [Drosera rotundifolia]
MSNLIFDEKKGHGSRKRNFRRSCLQLVYSVFPRHERRLHYRQRIRSAYIRGNSPEQVLIT